MELSRSLARAVVVLMAAAGSALALKAMTLLRNSPEYFFRREGAARAPGLEPY